MIKFFCDACGKQVEGTANQSIFTLFFPRPGDRSDEPASVKVQVRTKVAIDNAWNGGHICIPCLRQTIVEGKVSRTVAEAEGDEERDEEF